ncbi:hypothetical protein INT43_006533 [Umbelopsis isabellina]|uniref:Uncharacterized protein n=1 Tax=Mortierella isabellina TaxID=91625 RepID=A0A8H7Q064_MORIS|nr:hypothetical protein INT43_006533 [Umbelopsis isabellina]
MDAALNITMTSLHYAAQAYDMTSKALASHNITLPSLQTIVYSVHSAAGQLANAAASAGLPPQLSNILVNYNILPVFLALVWLYSIFCLFTMTLRWMYRVVFGFVRFSLIVTVIAFVVYHVQMYLNKDSEFVDSTPLHGNTRANYLRQQGVAP